MPPWASAEQAPHGGKWEGDELEEAQAEGEEQAGSGREADAGVEVGGNMRAAPSLVSGSDGAVWAAAAAIGDASADTFEQLAQRRKELIQERSRLHQQIKLEESARAPRGASAWPHGCGLARHHRCARHRQNEGQGQGQGEAGGQGAREGRFEGHGERSRGSRQHSVTPSARPAHPVQRDCAVNRSLYSIEQPFACASADLASIPTGPTCRGHDVIVFIAMAFDDVDVPPRLR